MSKHDLPPVKPIMFELSRVRAAHPDQFSVGLRRKRTMVAIEKLADATADLDAAETPEEQIDRYTEWRYACEEVEMQVSRSQNRQPPERVN